MIVTVSLWVDQLMNSVIGDLASYQKLYKVASLITLAVSQYSYIVNKFVTDSCQVDDPVVDDSRFRHGTSENRN
jgi:hypothetical protein